MFIFEWLNNQLLKMEWLNNLVNLLVQNVFGLNTQERLGGSIQFFITIATEFAAKGRSYATSLVAFFFMSGGGIGTAIGGKVVTASNYGNLFTLYGLGLLLVTISALFVKNSFKTSIQ